MYKRQAEGRTAQGHAGAAGRAGVAHEQRRLYVALEQHAGRAKHDDRNVVAARGLLEGPSHGGGVVGIDHAHILDAEGSHHGLYVQLAAGPILQGHAVEGVALAPQMCIRDRF